MLMCLRLPALQGSPLFLSLVCEHSKQCLLMDELLYGKLKCPCSLLSNVQKAGF